jgi:hypothetical protein
LSAAQVRTMIGAHDRRCAALWVKYLHGKQHGFGKARLRACQCSELQAR